MWTPYVMLICLAGRQHFRLHLRGRRVDRASAWRQF
jgi:ABC-type sugar transport system permease subunit